MNSFYDVLKHYADKEAERNTKRESISLYQLLAFEDHGKFLDGIPKDKQWDVVVTIAHILRSYNFNQELRHYSLYDDGKPIRKMLLMSKKESDKKGRIYKSDLKKAKDFRATLESFDERWAESKQEIVDYFIESGEDKQPIFTMVNILDDYIKDLESKTYEMANKYKYIPFPERPSKTPLKKYLQEIVTTYNLDGGRKLKTLIDLLNETPQY